jgi:hypothetical protein
LNRQPSNQYTWAVHFALAMVLCLWLYYARELHVSFSLTVVVAVAIMLCGGFVTSIRANGLFRRGEQAVAAVQGEARERESEMERLVFMLPALFFAFSVLYPERARNEKFSMHAFADWLCWALKNTQGNTVDWMMGRPDNRGRKQMLRGITGHLEQHERMSYEEYIEAETSRIISEMDLFTKPDNQPVHRRSHVRQDGGRRPQRGQRPRNTTRQRVPV